MPGLADTAMAERLRREKRRRRGIEGAAIAD